MNSLRGFKKQLEPTKQPRNPRLLAMVESDAKVSVLQIHGGAQLQQRLAGMGVVPGIDLEVIRNDVGDPLVVSVLDSRLMLGRGMAFKIWVQ